MRRNVPTDSLLALRPKAREKTLRRRREQHAKKRVFFTDTYDISHNLPAYKVFLLYLHYYIPPRTIPTRDTVLLPAHPTKHISVVKTKK